MQLPSLFNDSDEDEDMTFRLMNQRRSRFSKNNLDDEKSQFCHSLSILLLIPLHFGIEMPLHCTYLI